MAVFDDLCLMSEFDVFDGTLFVKFGDCVC
jgi:hypothetical protein